MGLSAASFEIQTARAWRCAVLTLSASGLLITALWVVMSFSRGDVASALWAVPAVLACLLAATSARMRRGRLRWDGQRWHLSESVPREVPDSPGSLVVAFDGGSWTLLRFRRSDAGRWPLAGTWLALARGDFPGDWHAWRLTQRPGGVSPNVQGNRPAKPRRGRSG